MWGWWSWWRHRKSSRSQVRKLRKLRVSYGAFRVYQIFVFNLVGHNFTYSIWFTEGGSNALSAQRCTHIRTRLVKDEEIKRRLTYTHSEKRGNGRNMSPAICLLCTYFSERRWHFTVSAIIHTLTKKKKREDERKIKWQRLEDDLCAPCQRFSTSVPTFRFLFVFFSPFDARNGNWNTTNIFVKKEMQMRYDVSSGISFYLSNLAPHATAPSATERWARVASEINQPPRFHF